MPGYVPIYRVVVSKKLPLVVPLLEVADHVLDVFNRLLH